jgi:membrane-associated phospholipid phosphatase
VGTSRIAYKKELFDDYLIKIDKFILGWFAKDGQISLYLDQNNFIGPHTTFGRFLNNSLQIFYFFYYLIPYIAMHFMSLLNCGKEVLFRFENKGRKSPSYTHRWSKTHFLFGTYLLTCVFVFFTNTLIPASSPRKHLADKYIHPLELSGFARYLNKKCKDDKSANSFPSGHVAEVLSIGLSYVMVKNYIMGIVIIFCSFLIGMATLFLRYHYFCDILAAIVCSLLSLSINYIFGYKIYLKEKENEGKNLEIKDNNKSLGIINVNINMDSSQKENKLNIGKLNDKIDKNHVELVEEKIN